MKSFKWLIPLIICIGTFMFHTNNVNAFAYDSAVTGRLDQAVSTWGNLGCSYSYNAGWTTCSFSTVNGYRYQNWSFQDIDLTNYNEIIIPLQLQNLYEQVNYSCTNTYELAYNESYTQYYGDGTTSDIIENVARNHLYECTRFSNINTDFTLQFGYYDNNGNLSPCEIMGTDHSLYAVCPITEARKNFKGFRFGITNQNGSDIKNMQFIFPVTIFFSKDNSSVINNINNNTTEINNSIKDSSIDNNNTSSSASSWANKNATNGTITNLLTLPISLLQNILNGIQTSCSNFSLGTLFNTELILPCINLSDLIGSTLFNVIDLLFSGFMILNIAKKLIKIFNDFTNLKSNQIDEIYSNGGGSN